MHGVDPDVVLRDLVDQGALGALQDAVPTATQYIWKKIRALAATASSIGLLAKELSPIAVPAAAAARATATSPSGCTACATGVYRPL